jgi:hypothetical protein
MKYRIRAFHSVIAGTVMAAALLTPASGQKKGANEPFHGNKAYCYEDLAKKTWTLGNDVYQRTIQLDNVTGKLMTTDLLLKPKHHVHVEAAESIEGEIAFQKADGSPLSLRLDRDWAYGWRIIATPAHGGRRLTVHLQGTKHYEGWEVEATYEVLPGNRPWMKKSFVAINRTGQDLKASAVVYDRITCPVVAPLKTAGKDKPKPAQATKTAGGDAATLIDPQEMLGLAAAVSPDGDCVADRGALLVRAKMNADVPGNGGRVETPVAVTAPFMGNHATGVALVKQGL